MSDETQVEHLEPRVEPARTRLRLPGRLPAAVQWILLIAATALLLQWVGTSAVESPYNGF